MQIVHIHCIHMYMYTSMDVYTVYMYIVPPQSIHTEHDVRVDDIIVSSLLVHPDEVHVHMYNY